MKLVAMNGNEPTTTSLMIAEGTENQHASVLRLVRENLEDFEKFGREGFEEFGRVGFEIQTFETAGGPQNRTIAVAEMLGLKPPVDESLGLELKTRNGVQALGAEKEKETGEIPWH